VAFGLALGVLAAYQQFKLPPALPLLLQMYGYPRTVAGAFMSVYAVAGLFLSVPVGRTLARRGPRALLARSFFLLLAGNALGLALPAWSPAMLGSRFLEGLGCAILAVVGAVVTTTSAEARHRPLAIALWATWIPVGQVLGTATAIPTLASGHWRPLWWAAGAATLGLALWGRRLAAAGSPALAAPAAPRGPESGEAHPAPAPRERASLLLAASLFGLWSLQYIAYVTWLPQYLVEAHGFAPGAAARAYLVPSVLTIVSNLWAGALLRRGFGLTTLLSASVACQGAVWFLAPLTRGFTEGLISLAAYGLSSGVTATALFALPSALFGGGAARGFGPIMAGRNLGVLAGPVLLAQAVTWAGGWQPVPALFGCTCVAHALLALYAGRRKALVHGR
jgi:predicted MFS family arabinose efflux permease